MKTQYILSATLLALSSAFASATTIGITTVSIIDHGSEQNARRTAENVLNTFGSTIDGTRDALGLEVGQFTSSGHNDIAYTSFGDEPFFVDFDFDQSFVIEHLRLFSPGGDGSVGTGSRFTLRDFEVSFSNTSDFSSGVTTTSVLTLGQFENAGQTFDLNIAGGLSDAQRTARYLRLTGIDGYNPNGSGEFPSLAYISFAGAAVIPEPSTYATLLGLAILPLLYVARRKR